MPVEAKTFRDLKPTYRCLHPGHYRGALRLYGERSNKDAVWFCDCERDHETARDARECAYMALHCDDGSLMAEQLQAAFEGAYG